VNVSVGVTTVNMSGIKNISKAELSNWRKRAHNLQSHNEELRIINY
jgi:hypothetical protein